MIGGAAGIFRKKNNNPNIARAYRGIPARPKSVDRELLIPISEILHERYTKWREGKFRAFGERNVDLAALQIRIAIEDNNDAYAICRYLERNYAYLHPDSNLVNEMVIDNALIQKAHRIAVSRWIEENKVKPHKNIDDHVVFRSGDGLRDGRILNFEHEEAKYKIRCSDSDEYFYVEYEYCN